jgi:hypothetical protein
VAVNRSTEVTASDSTKRSTSLHSPHPAAATDRPSKANTAKRMAGPAGIGALTLGALGVVFGDIGTSPL